SVVITTYNRQTMLDEAIASVLAQTIDDFECIVVDDAGPVPATGPADPRVRLVRREVNGGEPAARNTGLEAARGRYVAFLDDDDLFLPGRLALGLEGMQRAPLSVCFRRGSDGSAADDRILEGNVYDSILDAMTPQLGQVTVLRETAPRFDERFAGSVDIEWWLRAARAAAVSTVPRVGVVYRLHDGPRNLNGTVERVRCQRMLLEMYADYFATHPRAAAFRWKRIGLMSGTIGRPADARAAFRRSLRLRPELRTAVHLFRSYKPAAKAG
ncbi:MAG: glycosyltransferase family 2 protein, partial [Actinomycetota bacterium]